MNDQCKRFIELKNDLLVRLNLCYVSGENEIYMYENTLDAVINFLNFFTENQGVKYRKH